MVDPRIVSLLPSATEIVARLGALGNLVGRSEECDYPPEVSGLPIVMQARTHDGQRPSGEIDARVQASLKSGESLYEIDLDLLRRLRPSVVLTQDLCRVCSVTENEVSQACRSAGVEPEIVSLNPRRLSDVWATIPQVGAAIGRRTRSEQLAEELIERTADRPRSSSARIAVLEWLDPPILAGLWVAEMVGAAGGFPIGSAPGVAGPRTTWRDLAAQRPELVVVSPCSFSVARTRPELARSSFFELLTHGSPRLGVWIADEAFFSRPGPRLADGVDLLAWLTSGRSPVDPPMPVERWELPSAGLRMAE